MACRWAIMALFLRGAQSAPCSNDFWSDSSIKTLRTVAQELYVAPGSRTRARARLLSFALSQWLRCMTCAQIILRSTESWSSHWPDPWRPRSAF